MRWVPQQVKNTILKAYRSWNSATHAYRLWLVLQFQFIRMHEAELQYQLSPMARDGAIFGKFSLFYCLNFIQPLECSFVR